MATPPQPPQWTPVPPRPATKPKVWIIAGSIGGAVLLLCGCLGVLGYIGSKLPKESTAAVHIQPSAASGALATATSTPAGSPSLPPSHSATPAQQKTAALAAPPAIDEFGAKHADWDAHHQKDPKAAAGTAYNLGAVVYGSQPSDQFLLVLDMGTGRIVSFTEQFNRQTPFGLASSAVVAELPGDAAPVWQRTLPTCYQETFRSKTLGSLLGDAKIGDPQGLVFIEFSAGDPAAMSPAWSTSDVTSAMFSLGSASTAAGAPDC